MRNVFGKNVTLTLFGESHGPYCGATLDGMIPGVIIDEEYISEQLFKRRPQNKLETPRVEEDEYEFISGVFNGYTTGAPLTVIVKNQNVRSEDYDEMANLARPSHADYTGYVKANGYNDFRGGGHFSGRLTVAIVIMGAILQKVLESKNILIGTHILQVNNVLDRNFENFENEIPYVNSLLFPTLNHVENEMKQVILEASKKRDSVGGVTQTAIINLPVALGDPWFSSVESQIASACFAIGGIKGVEFGAGFEFAKMFGSTANDAIFSEDDKVYTKTNNNGGINGGLTNGMPVVFNCAIKPTPSIGTIQDTINLETLENTKLAINGRHDPAIIRRIVVVINAITALVVCDMLAQKYGENFLNFEA